MKSKFMSALATIAVVGFLSVQVVQAEDAHHPVSKTTTPDMSKSSGQMGGDMMGQMDMEHMKDMMQNCMDMHGKDHKMMMMCEHDMMDKCQAGDMKKSECKKMMNQAKSEAKKESKKK